MNDVLKTLIMEHYVVPKYLQTHKCTMAAIYKIAFFLQNHVYSGFAQNIVNNTEPYTKFYFVNWMNRIIPNYKHASHQLSSATSVRHLLHHSCTLHHKVKHATYSQTLTLLFPTEKAQTRTKRKERMIWKHWQNRRRHEIITKHVSLSLSSLIPLQ